MVGDWVSLGVARQAEALAAKTQTVTLTQHDAWGKLHTWTIEWQPELVDNDDAMANVGKVGIVWLDDCPVSTHVSKTTGAAILRALPRSFASSRSAVAVPYRVESADMGPGCWRVVSES